MKRNLDMEFMNYKEYKEAKEWIRRNYHTHRKKESHTNINFKNKFLGCFGFIDCTLKVQ